MFLTTSLSLTFTAAGAATGFVPYRAEAPVLPTADAVPYEEDHAASKSTHIRLRSTSIGPEIDRTESSRLEHGDPANAPPRSGNGRRVVYDMSDQRVWLVGPKDRVQRSYLVSGSVYDNLDAGRYDVYSRSRWAVSFDGQSTMEYFVRFTEGDNAAIGFHDIPEDSNGDEVQTADQLGTPRSHGCIRQRLVDAKAMWRFADIGTDVRVLA